MSRASLAYNYNGFDNTSFLSGNNSIDSLLIGFDWTGMVGQGVNLTYSFSGNTDAAFRADFTYALQTWATVANVHFNYISNPANAQITLLEDSTLIPQGELGVTYPNFSGTQLQQAEVHVDPNDPNQPAGHPDADMILTMIHELGHALGFKHPENYGGDADGLGPFLPQAAGTNDYTVMAYDYGNYASAANPAQTPMLYDIEAMQYLYGANTSIQNITVNITGALTTQTVWSYAGINTFNTTSYSGNTNIDLKQGQVSVVGQSNYFIAFNTHIQDLFTGNGNDSVIGNNAGDLIQTAQGADTIREGSGNDTVQGGQGNDSIIAGSGNDNINGNKGNDIIIGGSGASLLQGGQGNDSIAGGSGHDTITGNLGNDTLSGTNGANIFLFNNFNGALGQSLITDFNPAADKIEFNSAIFASPSAAIAATDSSSVIHMADGGTITLHNVSFSQLSASDFLIIG